MTVPECAHGYPRSVLCPECVSEVIRRTLSALPHSEPDPSPTPLASGAIAMHEMLLVYMNAGFSREEAMNMVLVTMSAGLSRMPVPGAE